jgi:hypothetical protein
VTNGQLKWKYGTAGYVISSPVVADLNGDGEQEIIVGSLDGKLYCLGLVTMTPVTSGQGTIQIAATVVIIVGIAEAIVGAVLIKEELSMRRKRSLRAPQARTR